MSNTATTQTQTKRNKTDRRKVVQVTILESAYAIALRHAKDKGTFPGRIIERSLFKYDAEETAQGKHN